MLGESEIPEALISQAMLKRKEWTKKYRISDAILFDLFSEFSSMMMIAKVDGIDKAEKEKSESKLNNSIKKKMGTTDYEDKMLEVLPATEDEKTSNLIKAKVQGEGYTLGFKDMQDFRIPIQIFKEYS